MNDLYHGSSELMGRHIGVCLTDDRDAAATYGAVITLVEIETSGLRIERVEVSREDYDSGDWPGDTRAGCDMLAAQGIDAVVYGDSDPHCRAHDTIRIVSERGLAALIVYAK